MTVPLVVGMPVYRRAWVLDRWFDSYEAQDPPDGTRLLFALSPSDDGTEATILRRAPDAEILLVDGLPSFDDDERDAPSRFAVLAEIRNRLLRRVASIGPDAYLSWDSDIILEPGAVRALLDAEKDAAGAMVDMGGEQYPGHWSWMVLSGDDALRPDLSSVGWRGPEAVTDPFQAGVIMGVKLLRAAAYRNARYADHVLGEDVAFSIQLRAMGVDCWVVPTARGEHVWRLPDRLAESASDLGSLPV